MTQQFQSVVYINNRKVYTCSSKNVNQNVHGNTIYNGPKLKTTQWLLPAE